uniref:Plasminogen receptor with a C-terminal lysine n=1 Tax=Bos mutus grunniens TaxID=30521 RepID=A0A8C0A6L1_BOSMU
MGFIFSKSMNENLKSQQEFMLMNSRLQLERQLIMQNEMRERQMAMQIAWSREFLKYFGTFFGITAVSLTAGAIKGKKPVLIFPMVPLGFVLAYQYDMGYGTLIHRMKVPTSASQEEAINNMKMQSLPEYQYKKANLPFKTRQEESSSSQDISPYIHEIIEFQKKNTNKIKTLSNLF